MSVKAKDRVLCYGKIEGTVLSDFPDFLNTYKVRFDTATSTGEHAWVKEQNMELIVPPLHKGDVITAESSEPPVGTLLVSNDGHALRRMVAGWRTTWLSQNITWEELKRNFTYDPHTWHVEYLPTDS